MGAPFAAAVDRPPTDPVFCAPLFSLVLKQTDSDRGVCVPAPSLATFFAPTSTPPPTSPSFLAVLLSNDHNGPWTIDQLEGKAAEEELVYGKLRYRLYIFRSGSFTNNGQRGWVMWAFSGCYPGWDGGNMVTFRPREECRS